MSQIIDGKAIAKKVRDEVAAEAAKFASAHGRPPGLEVVLVGEDPASVVYTRNKEKAALEAGVRGKLHKLPAETTEAELLALVKQLNDDDTVDGILVQLPLPKHIREKAVLDAIDPKKDVDGFHPTNAGLLSVGRPGLVPCTPSGVMRLLAEAGVKLEGARAVVIGRSNIVGKPMAQLLLAANATVTIAHSKTRDLAAVCREADVVVAAVGRAKMVTRDWIKRAAEVAGPITPVPGGVGPMTIACLLENTIKAAKQRL